MPRKPGLKAIGVALAGLAITSLAACSPSSDGTVASSAGGATEAEESPTRESLEPSPTPYDCAANWTGDPETVDVQWLDNCDFADFVTPEPTPTADPLNQADLTDTDGYQFRYTFATPTLTATGDITNAKPGDTEVSITVTGTITYTNTTPGRTAPVPMVVLRPVWLHTSPLCNPALSSTSRVDDRNGFNDSYDSDTRRYCSIPATGTYVNEALGDPGASMYMDAGGSSTVDLSQARHRTFTVAETDAPVFLDALEHPDGWVLLSSSIDKTGAYFVVETFSGGADFASFWTSPGMDASEE